MPPATGLSPTVCGIKFGAEAIANVRSEHIGVLQLRLRSKRGKKLNK